MAAAKPAVLGSGTIDSSPDRDNRGIDLPAEASELCRRAWLSNALSGARRNGDIQDGWLNIVQGLSAAMAISHLETYSGPGGWNDMVRNP